MEEYTPSNKTEKTEIPIMLSVRSSTRLRLLKYSPNDDNPFKTVVQLKIQKLLSFTQGSQKR